MVAKEIEDIIKRYVLLLKDERIDVVKVYLFGSWARGNNREDSDIDVALICNDRNDDAIEQGMKLWRLAVRVDTRLSPIFLTPADFAKDYVPIVPEIKNGLDMTDIAA